MAPKRRKSPPSDPHGMLSQMVVFFVETGVKAGQLQIWKHKLVQMGGKLEIRLSKKVTHIFAADFNSLRRKIDQKSLNRFEGKVVNYQWLEDSLRIGEKVPEDSYILSAGMGGDARSNNHEENLTKSSPLRECNSSQQKKLKTSVGSEESNEVSENAHRHSSKSDIARVSPGSSHSLSPEVTSPTDYDQSRPVSTSEASSLYDPPDLNRNITDIFKKLIDIYRSLGDDRRSFSYYKAVPVIEKLPFRIERADQVKSQPGIGKSLQDHIQEIVSTGKLSKLEHFEKDEKVRTISLFGEVWGIGPTTASKLYEKGHRTLDDLRNDESLTNSQMIGLKYFDDIKTRIPRQEVQEMENLLQKVGEEISPGADTLFHQNVKWKTCQFSGIATGHLDEMSACKSMYSVGKAEIVCGGSYRRGKASCGDLDIIITHPDGKSHIGFLPKFVRRLKDINFLREDLVFSVHSEEGTDSGVDTYFGLCTYPGRELRHRIDFKVFPRDIYAFGLLAWTGNDVLNRRLRLLAETKGFRLDDTGLFPATQSSGGKRGSKGSASLKLATEKQVFYILEFPWLEPNERNL